MGICDAAHGHASYSFGGHISSRRHLSARLLAQDGGRCYQDVFGLGPPVLILQVRTCSVVGTDDGFWGHLLNDTHKRRTMQTLALSKPGADAELRYQILAHRPQR